MRLNKVLLANCRYVLISVFLGSTIILHAQDDQGEIQLLDKDSKKPIVGATYQYSSKSGISSSNGIIYVQYIDNQNLIISHVSYGNWKLTSDEVAKALIDKIIWRHEVALNMQPITIIDVRSQNEENASLTLNNEERMAHDGGALLNRSPAINSIRKSGNYGFDPVLRGFKYSQLNVIIDGAQSANAACPNRMDPPTSQVAPNMIDHIEILKGPHSLRFGNSFGGTINFISTPAKFNEASKTYGRLSGLYESNGDIFRTEGMLGFRGNFYDLGFFGSWSQGNDYIDGNEIAVPADFQRGSFGTNLGFKLSNRQKIVFSVTRNLARDVEFPALAMDLRKDDTWLLNARHEAEINRKILKSWNTIIYGTIVDHFMDNLQKNLDPRMVNAETAATTKNFGGRTEGVWKYVSGSLYSGLDLKIDEAEGDRKREFLMGPNAGKIIFDNVWQDARINRFSAFAEYHMQKKNVQYVFSGRLEYNHSSLGNPDDKFTDVHPETSNTQINPGLSIGGTYDFRKGLTLGIWLGRSQRSGSLTERYINYFPVGLDSYEMLGNPLLEPEINNQADITFGYKKAKTIITADFFVSYMQNYISSVIDTSLTPKLPSSPGVRRFVNIGEAFRTGFEIGWNQNLATGLYHQMSIAYTYGEDLVRNEPLPEIAPLDFRYILYGSFYKSKIRPEFTFRYVTKQERVSSAFGETKSPAFSLVDISLAYKFNKIISSSVGIRNLFNTAYYEHLNRTIRGTDTEIYAPGRSIYITLTFNFM